MPENIVKTTGDWTKELEDRAVALYKEHKQDVDKVATEMGRARRSVIGKLSVLGVYIKPEKAAPKKRDEGPTKGEIQTAIEKEFNFSMEGFDPTSKPGLQRLYARFTELAKVAEAA